MSWKDKLKVSHPIIFSQTIDEYFKNLGFYESTMNPRFFDGIYYEKIKEGKPVLRFDGDWDWDGGGVQRVFMNKREIYIERQTSYRSYDGSDYHHFEKPPTTIEEIEKVLERIVKQYEKN